MEEASSSSAPAPAPAPAPVPRKIFVGGIFPKMNEEALTEHFKKYGKVERAVVVRDRSNGNSRGFGFVTFADDAAAISASDVREKDRHRFFNQKFDVKRAMPKEHMQGESSRNSSNGKKIFVGGLPNNITNEEFKTYFEKFGIVTDSIVMHNHTRKTPRGFGFVTFNSEESASELVKNQFYEINHKMVEVKRAIPKIIINNSNPNPSPTRARGGGNNATNNNNNVSSNFWPPLLHNFNVHSYTPYYYPINDDEANVYSQLHYHPIDNNAANGYSPYVIDDNNDYYLHTYSYNRRYAPQFATYYPGWYCFGPRWADQNMKENDAFLQAPAPVEGDVE